MTSSRTKGFIRTWCRVLAGAILGVAALLGPGVGHAKASGFDHFTTGFELLGRHSEVPCESCHVGGIFKGTPTDCFSCHAAGSRIGASAKPVSHILSANDCAKCHTPFAWKPVAMFNHINVIGTCSSCHNNMAAIGKGPKHVQTLSECSTCHLLNLPWKAATYDHTGITGNCARCHNNIIAPGKPPKHMPTQQPCETCHSPTNFKTFGGTSMNHSGITDNCQACHETGMGWIGVTMVDRPTSAQDPLHPSVTSSNGLGADCANCHKGFNVGDFNKVALPSYHIPVAPGAACNACHKTGNFADPPALADIHANAPSTTTNCQQCHSTAAAAMYSLPQVHFTLVGLPASGHIPTAAGCETCHVGGTSNIGSLPVGNGAKFANSSIVHDASMSTCNGCHGSGITQSTFTGITKIVLLPPTAAPGGLSSHIPSGPTDCSVCHVAPSGLLAGNAPSLTVPGTKFASPAPSGVQIHANSSVTNCNSCHEGNRVWAGMAANYAQIPAALSAVITTPYHGFNTRPGPAGTGTFSLTDKAHPTGQDCSACHTRTDYFEATVKPTNHIPYLASAICANCHTNPDFSVLPAVGAIHTYSETTLTNCVQCHGTTQAATYAIPAANFTITTMTKLAAAKGGTGITHVATSASCEVCHVGAASSINGAILDGSAFTGSAINHSAVSTTCNSCHLTAPGPFTGITSLVLLPPTAAPGGLSSHIPSGTTDCSVCHGAPSGQIAGNAPSLLVPGTKFNSPVPSGPQIHTNVSANCNACHEKGLTWVGMALYPQVPTVVSGVATDQYRGFNERPIAGGTGFSLNDASHPTTKDCSVCHGSTTYFEAQPKPANHIPYLASASCANCHTNPDFSVLPAVGAIHTYSETTLTNCVQCHGTTQAATYAIPAANFTITTMTKLAAAKGGTGITHVATSSSCEVCHVGAASSINGTILDASTFAGSAINHSAVSISCNGCHAAGSGPYTGVASLIVLPPTSPASASAHIPSGTTDCGTCHVAPTGQIAGTSAHTGAVTANSTKFVTPVPTTGQIHSGITANCTNCHEKGYVWLGMTQASYQIAPKVITANAQYTGFNTRPVAAASTFSVADAPHPATGDCVGCHGNNFNYFTAQAEPANHYPTTPGAPCTDCHVPGNNSDYSKMNTANPTVLTAMHKDFSTTCSGCHADTAPTYVAAAGFKIMRTSGQAPIWIHIPINASAGPAECSGCHKNVTSFGSTTMSHGAIGDFGTAGASNFTAVATGMPCDTCHEIGMQSLFKGVSIRFIRDSSTHYLCGTAPGTYLKPNTTNCAGGGADCLNGCHQHTSITNTYKRQRRPTAKVPTASATVAPQTARPGTPARRLGLQTFGGGAFDHSTATGQACVSCHKGGMIAGKGPLHPKTTDACGDCHSTTAFMPVLRVDHADVLGNCSTCHNGKAAAGKAPNHPVSGNDCDRCHTTSAWKPAVFDHSAVLAGTCSTCHNSLKATGLPAKHVLTQLSCDSCHYVLGWTPVKPARPAVVKTPTAATPPVVQPPLPRLPPPHAPQPPRGAAQQPPAVRQ